MCPQFYILQQHLDQALGCSSTWQLADCVWTTALVMQAGSHCMLTAAHVFIQEEWNHTAAAEASAYAAADVPPHDPVRT